MTKQEQTRRHRLSRVRLLASHMQLADDGPAPCMHSHYLRIMGAASKSRSNDNGVVSKPKILIVENDGLLNSLTVELMEDAGLMAFQAGDADEAMAILEARSDIAVLLTSVVMPSFMDGLDLAHVVHERWPTIRIVVASSQARLADEFPPASRFFLKPYLAAAMISEIRSLMAAKHTNRTWGTLDL